MNRLTRTANEFDYCRDFCKNCTCPAEIHAKCLDVMLYEKLRDYEDTGLEPKEVRSVKWIPVTERLPEETGPYLVWMLWPHDETHVHSIINFDADCEAFGEWEEYYDPVSLGWAGSDFIKIENVYAWMPLPEPPEGGADG